MDCSPQVSDGECDSFLPQNEPKRRDNIDSDVTVITSRLQKSLIANGILCFLLLAVLLSWIQLSRAQSDEGCIRPKLIYTPAISAMQFERKTLHRSLENNKFTGTARPELDEAWHELLAPITIKISEAELALLGEESIALKDGSGFLAEMTVFHELHCVKRIRRHLHLEYYYPNMTAEERIIEDRHMDHCLEYWREAAMCRGDPTLTTFEWEDGFAKSRVWSRHECVDWSVINDWALSRSVDVSDYRVLSPPM